MDLNLLEKSILATVAYYDVLDYPLTGFEALKYLISPSHIIAQSKPEQSLVSEPLKQPSFLDILKTLKSRPLSNFIEEKNGFYFLKGREKIIKTRIERQKISDQKWKKAGRIISKLQMLPYFKLVAVSGSLALDNTKKQSDIDLLIITKHKRIWTVRFLVTFFIQILGKRRHGKKTADRICLNHYITDRSLKIDFPSLYNAQTYAHLIPVLEIEEVRLDSQEEVDPLRREASARRGIYKKFQEANQWIENYLAFYPGQEDYNQRLIKERRFFRKIARSQEFILNSFLGNVLEKLLALIQKTIIKYHSSKERDEGRVITDDFQLEFHPSSPEKNVLNKYNEIILTLRFKMKKEKDSGLA